MATVSHENLECCRMAPRVRDARAQGLSDTGIARLLRVAPRKLRRWTEQCAAVKEAMESAPHRRIYRRVYQPPPDLPERVSDEVVLDAIRSGCETFPEIRRRLTGVEIQIMPAIERLIGVGRVRKEHDKITKFLAEKE